MIGLQLHGIVERLRVTGSLIVEAAAIAAAVIVIRVVWVPVFTYLPRWLFRSIRERDPYPPWQAPAVISWAGVRGAVSLAAALALPADLPHRDLMVFFTFAVILVTLVGQGLTLPVLIRVLGVEDDGGADREDAKARIKAAEAALARLDELADEDWVNPDTARAPARLVPVPLVAVPRALPRHRRGRGRGALGARIQRLRRELLDAERQAVLSLRNEGVITEEVMQRVQRDIDLEDSRLDA